MSIPGPVKLVKSGTLGTLATVNVALALQHTFTNFVNFKFSTSPAAVIVDATVVPGTNIPVLI